MRSQEMERERGRKVGILVKSVQVTSRERERVYVVDGFGEGRELRVSG